MPTFDQWRLSVSQGLSSHFNQPHGASRPGTLWTVIASRGTKEKRLLVQIYTDGRLGTTTQQQAAIALAYISSLINNDWNPDDYKGEPGELVVPDDFQKLPSADALQKPWWRFW